jgi:hypothetical protein
MVAAKPIARLEYLESLGCKPGETDSRGNRQKLIAGSRAGSNPALTTTGCHLKSKKHNQGSWWIEKWGRQPVFSSNNEGKLT